MKNPRNLGWKVNLSFHCKFHGINETFEKVVVFLSLEFFPDGKLCSILLIQA